MSIFRAIEQNDIEQIKKRLKPTVWKKKGQLNKVDKNGNTPLHYAVQYSQNKEIFEIIEKAGPNPNSQNNYGRTPLHIACLFKVDVSVIQSLLTLGSDLNIQDNSENTPFHFASAFFPKHGDICCFDPSKNRIDANLTDPSLYYHPNSEIIKLLIKKGAKLNIKNNDKFTPLHLLCMNKVEKSILELILSSGADINAQNKDNSTPLHYICKTKQYDLIDTLLVSSANTKLKDMNDETPLHLLCYNELDINSIQKLILADADVNSQNRNQESPLHLLCKNSFVKPEFFDLFAKANAQFNARNSFKDTPLHIACKYHPRNYAIISKLIDLECDVNIKNNYEQSPLHILCLCAECDERVLKLLLKKNSKINEKDMSGNTPLHLACKFKLQQNQIKLLLDYGADKTLLTTNHKKPEDLASPEIVEFIKSYIPSKSGNQESRTNSKSQMNISINLISSNTDSNSNSNSHSNYSDSGQTNSKPIENINATPKTPNKISTINFNYQPIQINKEIDFESLILKKFIARGSFKEVFQGVWLGLDVAVMKLLFSESMSELEMNDFKTELSILSQLAHPNIVQFFGACTKEPNLCIIVEFCHQGNLFDYLQSEAQELPKQKQLRLAMDITKGIYYLHAYKIIHRDLKSPNILLDEFGVAKIADFGLSRTIDKSRTHLNSMVGTFNWMAPEIMYGDNYSFPADIYSLGIILWEIQTRKVPFEGLSAAILTKRVAIENKRLDLPQNGIFNSVIQQCWRIDPKKRPTIDQVLKMIEDIKSKL